MLKVIPIPAFDDNYFWLIQPNVGSDSVCIVDPGAAEPVIQALTKRSLKLAGILVTHHHHDHIDGVETLRRLYQVPVYGPHSKKIPQVTDIVAEGDKLKLGDLSFAVLAIPGHTVDHIAYYAEPADTDPLLFSGDTLFAGGCGRLFDGTAAQLFTSLNRIATLPDSTLVYAAHEYTLSNLKFALTIEPGNLDLIARQKIEQQTRASGFPTLPTTVGLEKLTNPFLRCHLNQIKDAIEAISGEKLYETVDVFTKLRRTKDQF